MKNLGCILFVLLGTLASFSQSKAPTVPVHSIFISEEFPDDFVRFNTGKFQRALKTFLTEAGIDTPNRAKDADAELVIAVSATITLDGPADEPDKVIYDCKLVSPTGEKIRTIKKSFVSKKTEAENDSRGASLVAEELIRLWKKGKLRVTPH